MCGLSPRFLEELLKVTCKAYGLFQMETVTASGIDGHRDVFEPVHRFVGMMDGDDGITCAPEEREWRLSTVH